nr:hypothetical protein [uncultured Acetatifactor sp.]
MGKGHQRDCGGTIKQQQTHWCPGELTSAACAEGSSPWVKGTRETVAEL